MPKTIAPLTDVRCRQAKHSKKGEGNKLFDGAGLYLDLKSSGAKKWRFKYRQANGKENLLTFGDYPTVSLQQAREQRDEARRLIALG